MQITSVHKRSNFKNYVLLLLLILPLCFFSTAQKSKTDFDYLRIKGRKIISTHAAQYQIVIKRPFEFIGEFHHQPVYGEKQFNVSFAAFSNKEKLIMIHAETHSDGSGGLDYSNLEPAELTGLKFFSREQCAAAEDAAELNENPQIKFLREKGFDIKPPFYLKQYFTTDPKGISELVISYGKPVASCDGNVVTTEFKKQIEREAGKNLQLKKLS